MAYFYISKTQIRRCHDFYQKRCTGRNIQEQLIAALCRKCITKLLIILAGNDFDTIIRIISAK
jgi:hypothetical protein